MSAAGAGSVPRGGFVVWDRKIRGPVAGPFPSRCEARRVLAIEFGGDLRKQVRQVNAKGAVR